MNLSAIHAALYRRVGANNITFSNGESKRIHVGGTPRSFFEIQNAIAAVQEIHPDSQIDLELALRSLRSKN